MIFRNQYVIQKDKYEHIDFKYINIGNKILSYEKHVPIHISQFQNKQIIVLGWAYRIDIVDNDIFTGIDNLCELMHMLSGRFIVIYDNIIYKDFLGVYDVFFSKKLDIIASDIHFIDNTINYTYIDEYFDDIDSIYFNMSPFLDYKYIYRLPARLSININTLKMNRIDFLNQIKSNIKYDDMVNKLYQYTDNILHNMNNQSSNIVIALSAGYDSRALLQCILHSGIKFSILNHKVTKWKIHDEIIPKVIAQQLNIKVNDANIINDEGTLFLNGSEWDKFHCALKDRNNVSNKLYSYETINDFILDAFGINIINKTLLKNFRFYNIFMKKYLEKTKWHPLDLGCYYYYLNNYYGARSSVIDSENKSMLLLCNSYSICNMFLKFPYMISHGVAMLIIDDNDILKKLPINALSTRRNKEKYQYIQDRFNDFCKTWLDVDIGNKRSIYR